MFNEIMSILKSNIFKNKFKYFNKKRYSFYNESFNRFITNYIPKSCNRTKMYYFFINLSVIYWNNNQEKDKIFENLLDEICQE